MALTKEQQVFAEANHNLIYTFLRKYELAADEWYDVAAIEYVKACASYEADVAKFSTFAYKCMWYAVIKEKRRSKATRRTASVQSLDAPAFGNDTTTLLSEIVPDTNGRLHDNIVLTAFWVRLSDEQRRLVRLKSIGHSQKEISEMMHTSQPRVSRTLSAAKAILWEEIIG